MKRREILVTSALPYANAPLHLGHMLEAIQTDIWCRFQRQRGHHCYYVCADDAHGTAIMLKAEENGVSPQQHIESIKILHEADLTGFGIALDNFYSTHSPENKELAGVIYKALEENGHIVRRQIIQAYDAEKGLFLADRFIKGTCPRCKTPDQYGDNCEACGATYTPADLIDPVSALSGSVPVEKESEHFFVDLSQFQDFLREWLASGSLQQEIANKLKEWLDEGLQPWDISRDAPYFGFEIPGHPGKYFYVWLDAPIGYMASFQNLCQRNGIDFDRYWRDDSQTELYHFIGKDIINFHGLFWPAMLKSAGFRLPTAVYAHGFVTVNGTKMSKSRGTFINAASWLRHLPAESLRYYYAAKLGPGVEDIDLNLEDFINRVNADLVGKVVNIASRCSGFLKRLNNNCTASALSNQTLWHEAVSRSPVIAEHFEKREYSRAVREIMTIADRVNEYIAAEEPWKLAKQDETRQQAISVCSDAINLFRLISIWLQPVMPQMCASAAEFLDSSLDWDDSIEPLLQHQLNDFSPLMTRIEADQVNAMLEENVTRQPDCASEAKKASAGDPDKAGLIDFATFASVDLRVGKVLEAELVEGADKLLRLVLDTGEGQIQVFSGIRAWYQPEEVRGRNVVYVANLQPRKMKFGVSEGMVLCSDDSGESGLRLLEVSANVPPGTKIA